MQHSIIIPHRNYNGYLRVCLWSLGHSATVCGETDYEVIVVDQGSIEPPRCDDPKVTIIRQELSDPDTDGRRYFNKPRALNAGIAAAGGKVLSVLDADAIVGQRWMDGHGVLRPLGPRPLTKLCYRVRYLPESAAPKLDRSDPQERARLLFGPQGMFARYWDFQRAIECYGEPEKDPHNNPPGRRWDRDEIPEQPVFGNSQFSIRAETLGELRFDEEYAGRGFEDLAMNREIWRRQGPAYRATILFAPDQAMFHLRNPLQGELWGAGKRNEANRRRYYRT